MSVMSRLRDFVAGPPLERSWPYVKFDGIDYPLGLQTTLGYDKQEPIDATFAGIAEGAYRGNSLVFACINLRAMLFSEATFAFREVKGVGRGKLFWRPSLRMLERPWPNGTTSDLLTRALLDHDIAGNAFFVRRPSGIKRLEPQWVTIVLGGERADLPPFHPDLVVAGYAYQPPTGDSYFFNPEEVAHFAATQDPLASYRGMSWVTPLIREVMAENAASSFKLRWFENSATPNMVVHVRSVDPKKFNEWVQIFRQNHEGMHNAYRTLYLAEGSDATVVGSNLRDMTFTELQGKAETRIAAAAGIPPAIVGFSEGLQGSSLNAGNYEMAKQRFAHMTMHPLWRNIAHSFTPLIDVPTAPPAELWFNTSDIPFLQTDEKVAAEMRKLDAETMNTLITAGFDPDSVRDAVTTGDLTLVEHTGMTSVQLHTPGANPPTPEVPAEMPEMEPAVPGGNGKAAT